MMKTTAIDKVLRELQIIETIFKSQFSSNGIDPNITLVNEKGDMLMTGRFINQIHLFSDQELFNIQEFKGVITERFETVQNPVLLKNQLIEVYNKAVYVRDLFNENLTGNSDVFKRFKFDIDSRKKAELELHPSKKFSWIEYYSAAVTVYNNFLGVIYFGLDRIIRGKELEFRYLFDNYTLASICQTLIEFIDKFEIISNTPNNGSSLSAFESALMYFILFRAGKEANLTPIQVADKYSIMFNNSHDNIRKAVPTIEARHRNGEPLANKKQFQNVQLALNGHPDIKKSIDNLIAMIN
ncbi:hypothetical protein WG906_09795 [Pedobacter sp. P351]|uniref:hypothetical protein n=1 Tax=Pedobacter superstes TaxID=3133441 RepID=UPI003098EFF7